MNITELNAAILNLQAGAHHAVAPSQRLTGYNIDMEADWDEVCEQFPYVHPYNYAQICLLYFLDGLNVYFRISTL